MDLNTSVCVLYFFGALFCCPPLRPTFIDHGWPFSLHKKLIIQYAWATGCGILLFIGERTTKADNRICDILMCSHSNGYAEAIGKYWAEFRLSFHISFIVCAWWARIGGRKVVLNRKIKGRSYANSNKPNKLSSEYNESQRKTANSKWPNISINFCVNILNSYTLIQRNETKLQWNVITVERTIFTSRVVRFYYFVLSCVLLLSHQYRSLCLFNINERKHDGIQTHSK